MSTIRQATAADQNNIWDIIHQVISSSKYYAFSPDTSKNEMLSYWCAPDKRAYVALLDGRVAGTFILKDNQPGLGNHIANASYMTLPELSGRGIGTLMAKYSFEEAKKLGYRAMQFNMVVKSNNTAIQLWLKLGFAIIGEIPDAFRHPERGFINAYIMYKKL